MTRRVIALLLVWSTIAAGCADDADPPTTDAPSTETSDPVETSTPPDTSTTPETSTPPDTSDDEPEPAPQDSPGPLVDLAWHDDQPDHVLLDARDPENHLSGHIPGSRSVPASALNDPDGPISYQLGTADHVASVLGAAGVTADDTLVLYDADGSLFAARLYWALTYYGHTAVHILDGGLTAWTEADRPVATDPAPTPASTDYVIGATRTDLRLELPGVTEALAVGLTTFADARSSAEYVGAQSFNTAADGHIPGANNVDYATTIDDDGRFLPRDELATLYDAAGIGPGTEVVTYCLVGARAAHTWFVLSELLEYPSVSLYDGSWIEYGNTEGVDVES